MIKIDKNIPLPVSSTMRGPAKYPFEAMEVGDSFAVPGSNFSRLHGAAYGWGKRHGCKFAVKKEGDAFRVWRVT